MGAYDSHSPGAAKRLHPDGSVTDADGNQITPPSDAGAADYAGRSPAAAKWLLPDGTVTGTPPGGTDAGALEEALAAKVDNTDSEEVIYGTDAAGQQKLWKLDVAEAARTVPIRQDGGELSVGEPQYPEHAATKGYVDAAVEGAGVPEAPVDGNQYVRQDSGWAQANGGIKVHDATITYSGRQDYNKTSFISINDENLRQPLPIGTVLGFKVDVTKTGCDLSIMGVKINGTISEDSPMTLRAIGTNQTYYTKNIISLYNTNLYFMAKKPDGRWEVLNWPKISDSAFADAVSAAKGGTGMTSGPAAKNFRMPVIGGTATNYASSKMKYVDAPTDDGGYAYLFVLKEKGAEPAWVGMVGDLSASELADAPPKAQAVKDYVDAAIAQAIGVL
jgi:hypothetical protein